VWFTKAALDDGPATAVPTVADSDGSVTPLNSSMDSTGQPVLRRTRLDQCGTAEDRLDVSLRAAGPAMEQWEVHVGAMNKLVVGAISLQQATDFWNQTRLAARKKIASFDDAVGSMRRSGLNCPLVGRLGHASRALRACVQRVDADERAVTRARTAIDTWAAHVEDMDMLRMGNISPAAATQAWLASWKQGAQEIQAYQGAARGAQRAGGC
jgi:hypothetical protein